MLLRFAWRNLWRNPRRTAIVVVAVSVGIAGSLLSMGVNYGMVDQMVVTAIRTELGHIQVHAAGWEDEPTLQKTLPGGAATVVAALERDPRVRAWTRRVRGDGLVNSPRASAGVRVIGVEGEREGDVSLLREALVAGNWLGAAPRRALLGESLAERLQVELGDKIAVSVQDASGDLTGGGFRVGGLFHTPSSELDRSTLLLGLGEAQVLFALGDAVSEVVVVVHDPDEVEALRTSLAKELGPQVEVRSWAQLEPLLVYMVQSFDMMAWYLYAAVFTAMAFGIANVLLMAVHERTREIGMLRAIGMSRRRVVAMVVLESMWVTGVGLAVGMAVALGATWLLRDGIDLSAFAQGLAAYGVPPRLSPVLRARDFGMPLVIAGVAAGLASLWPALHAARERPAEALRHV